MSGKLIRFRVPGPVLEDYERRCVYPEVKAHVAELSEESAREILGDAEWYGDRELGPELVPSTLRRAYGRLAENLRKALRED